jgi:hypothetical protein
MRAGVVVYGLALLLGGSWIWISLVFRRQLCENGCEYSNLNGGLVLAIAGAGALLLLARAMLTRDSRLALWAVVGAAAIFAAYCVVVSP